MTHTLGRRHQAVRVVAVALIALTGVTLGASTASAAPPATSATDVARLMAQRAHQLEQVTEAFDAARDDLARQQAAAAAAPATVSKARRQLAAARAPVAGIARSAYMGGQLGGISTLLTSSSAAEVADRAGTLEVLAARAGDVLRTATAASDAAVAADDSAQQAVARARATLDAVTSQRAALQGQVAAYQSDFDRLSAAEQRATLAGATGTSVEVSRSGRSTVGPIGAVSAGNAAAQTAVDTALAQRGKPYVWAAAGPDSFDCSGLTEYAYASAGISLPHSSAGQAQLGAPVSRAQLQPGDLVFFYTPISHVGLYIGNGQMVHAPTAGDVVKVSDIDAMGSITAFRRPTG